MNEMEEGITIPEKIYDVCDSPCQEFVRQSPAIFKKGKGFGVEEDLGGIIDKGIIKKTAFRQTLLEKKGIEGSLCISNSRQKGESQLTYNYRQKIVCRGECRTTSGHCGCWDGTHIEFYQDQTTRELTIMGLGSVLGVLDMIYKSFCSCVPDLAEPWPEMEWDCKDETFKKWYPKACQGKTVTRKRKELQCVQFDAAGDQTDDTDPVLGEQDAAKLNNRFFVKTMKKVIAKVASKAKTAATKVVSKVSGGIKDKVGDITDKVKGWSKDALLSMVIKVTAKILCSRLKRNKHLCPDLTTLLDMLMRRKWPDLRAYLGHSENKAIVLMRSFVPKQIIKLIKEGGYKDNTAADAYQYGCNQFRNIAGKRAQFVEGAKALQTTWSSVIITPDEIAQNSWEDHSSVMTFYVVRGTKSWFMNEMENAYATNCFRGRNNGKLCHTDWLDAEKWGKALPECAAQASAAHH
jgi:hypothetical protein